MKKLYLLTFGLLCGSLASFGQEVVENLTTGVTYGDLKVAFDAVESGQIIQINDTYDLNNCSDRCVGKKNSVYIIQGKESGVTLTGRNFKNNQLFLANQTNVSMTFKNLIFDGTNKGVGQPLFAAEQNNDVLTFENIEIKNYKSDKSAYIYLKGTNSYTVNMNNVKFTNCTFNSKAGTENLCNINVTAKATLNLSGDNDLTIYYEGAGTVNVVGELTNTTPITLIAANGTTVVKGYTDASKFQMSDPELKLVVENGNLVAKSADYVAPVTLVTNVDAANGDFATLEDALAYVNKYNTTATETIETATITLNENQKFTSRQTFAGVEYIVKSAEGKDVSIVANVSNSAMLVNGGGKLTLENVTVCGDGGTKYSRHQIESIQGNSVVTLKNVTVRDMDVTGAPVVKVMNGGKVVIENVTVSNCDDATAFAFIGSNGSSVTGNSNTSLVIEKNCNVNAAGWTPAEPVDITLDGTRDAETVVLLNFTDLAKVNLTNGEEKNIKFAVGTEENANNIMAVSTVNTGIDDVIAGEENCPVEYFNLQGVKVENPANGLYIKRQGNKVSKVLVK